LLHKRTEHHQLRVVDTEGVRSLEFDGHRQSAIRLDDGFASDIRYTDYLHLTLALNPDPHRVLVLGLGGGALPKRMWRDYPAIERIDCVDIDPEIVEIARRYFELPEDDRLCVHVDDGRHFVQRSTERYDIAAIDAYYADAIPYALATEEFFRELDERLADDGVAAYNVIGAVEGWRSRTLRAVYKTMRQLWPRVYVFPVDLALARDPRRIRNVILLGTRVALSDRELAARIGSRVGGRVTIQRFPLFAEDLYTQTIATRDVPVLVDATSPPDGLLRLLE